MSNIKLIHGDCLEIMKNIPDKSIDMILCDLPYGTTACKWDSVIPFEPLWEQYNKIIKPNGIIVLFGCQPFTSKLICSNLDMFKYEIIWEKEQGTNQVLCNVMPMKKHENICIFYRDLTKNNEQYFIELKQYFKYIYNKIGLNKKQIINKIGQSADHCFRFKSGQWSIPTEETYNKIASVFNLNLKPYKCIKNKYDKEFKITYNPQFSNGKEYIVKRNNKERFNPILGTSIKPTDIVNKGIRYPTSILKFNRDLKNRFHPTQKPVALLEYLIKTYSNENETILDNCMGSASTGIACINTNRNFIGIEKDDKYFDISCDRINNYIKDNNLTDVNVEIIK